MKNIFRAFLRRFSFRSQLTVIVTGGVLGMAFLSSLLGSWQATEQARRDLIQQGQRITENLARQSVLSLLYASPDNVTDAVNATLAFPGIRHVEIRDVSRRVLLERGGSVYTDFPGQFTVPVAPVSDGAASAGVVAVLVAENDFAWQFSAPVLSQPGEESPYEMQPLVRELLGQVVVEVSKDALIRLANDIFRVNMASSFALAIVLLMLIRFLTKRMMRPLDQLSKNMARAESGEVGMRATEAGPKDIAKMAHAFNSMMAALEIRSAELRRFNETLEHRVMEEAVKSRQKDHLLIQQSRLAAIGEMIGNIAHQWRQPINALTLLLANIKDAYDHNEMDPDYMDKLVKNGQAIIQRMSTTIDDFRNFFRPNKEKSLFSVNETIADVLRIMEAAFKNSNITFNMRGDASAMTYGIRNEYAQVLINLLANSKEAVQEQKIVNAQITVVISTQDGKSIVEIEDNAGGIPEHVLPRIFDPYFTTKQTGTGIGLYMSKVIIEENMGGSIVVNNIEGGVRFTITTPAG